MNKLIFSLLSALLTVIALNAQNDPVVDSIIKFGKTDNQVMKHLDVLCNRIGGRPIGSDAYQNAEQWAAEKFEEWGMEVILDEVGELPVGFNRGPWFGRLLSDEGFQLHFVTPSYTAGTKGVQRGPVLIEPMTKNEFERMKGKLKGVWVLVGGTSNGWPIDYSEAGNHRRDSIKKVNEEIEQKNNDIRHWNWTHRNEEKKEMLEMVREPGLFYKEMCEAGILGIIQSAPVPLVALYDRKNIMKMTFENLPEIPDIKLDENQYKIIEQMAKERRTFELEFDIRNHFNPGPVKYHNVIGVIPGTEFPDEYVIMGGHLDSHDVATGGVDDGSGSTPAMEAARLIMKAGGKPKRTILVCLWAGEEYGLLGSESWVERNKDKLEKVSNMFNRDGGPLAISGISVTEAMMKDFEKICAPLNSINPDFPFSLEKREPSERPKEAWGTDSGPFAVAGVTTVEFSQKDFYGLDFNYREIWHTERDLFTKSIPSYQEHSAIVTAVVVYGVACLDHLLSKEGYYLEEVKESGKKKK